jgi:GGDEF domain-containing protein
MNRDEKLDQAHDAADLALRQFAKAMKKICGESQSILLVSRCERDFLLMSLCDTIEEREELIKVALIDCQQAHARRLHGNERLQ